MPCVGSARDAVIHAGGRCAARARVVRGARGIAMLAAAFAWARPSVAVAQAWLPEAGTLDFGVTYDHAYSAKHYLPNGSEFDAGHTTSDVLSLYASYALTDRLTVSGGIPYVRRRYHGSLPHPTDVDDGNAHATFTDARVELHWQAVDGPFALAPYTAYVVPTHRYEALGHAAPGRRLWEYWLGSFAGASLEPWVPRSYAQLHYVYAFVEKVAGVAHDRSNLEFELGHFVTPEWGIAAYASWQFAHGGIDVPVPPSHPLYRWHDQLAREEYLNVGGGATWAPTGRFSVSLRYMKSLHGRNGHKLDDGLTLAFGFRPGKSPD
jgi:hypothetical protein